jgi:hypothetical protein
MSTSLVDRLVCILFAPAGHIISAYPIERDVLPAEQAKLAARLAEDPTLAKYEIWAGAELLVSGGALPGR